MIGRSGEDFIHLDDHEKPREECATRGAEQA
jgi:hypothetical protein